MWADRDGVIMTFSNGIASPSASSALLRQPFSRPRSPLAKASRDPRHMTTFFSPFRIGGQRKQRRMLGHFACCEAIGSIRLYAASAGVTRLHGSRSCITGPQAGRSEAEA
jgi:hypothetical protein